MAALRNFNGLASWKNAENSLQSVNLTMPCRLLVLTRASAELLLQSADLRVEVGDLTKQNAAQLTDRLW